MIKQFSQSIKVALGDRGFFGMIIAVVIASLAYTIFTLLAIHASDIQIVTQYSAFGESHFYKNPWTYLYTFSFFGLLVGAVHSLIMVKLHHYGRRLTGVIFGWLTIMILVIAFIIFKSVLQLAYL